VRAATFSHTGPAREVLHLVDVPTPDPGPGEVRVKIAASGVNPSDVKRRNAAPAGKPAEFPSVIPHSDGAGTIDAVGAGVPQSRLGERVWTLNAQYQRAFGTAAEYCVLSSDYAFRLPDGIDFAIGACIGIPMLTAYHGIMLDGSMRNKTLLVQGGSGAVGFYAIQFAKMAGARVITTVSSEQKAETARSAGADHIINYRTDDLKARIAELTNGTGVDRVIEVDLKANAMTYPQIAMHRGKAVVYGSGAPPIELPVLIPTAMTLEFIYVYTLTAEQRATYIPALTTIMEAGTLKHLIGEHFPLEQIVAAHEAVEAGAFGNVIVDIAT
jgi:NADPH2:quinone reductase